MGEVVELLLLLMLLLLFSDVVVVGLVFQSYVQKYSHFYCLKTVI